ncbi:MAG: signal peptidase II [Hyphomicrobiales bacterium]|nr:signal peptidase II [Hyphomicrobiales bacterium]
MGTAKMNRINGVILIILLAGFDQLSKYLVEQKLPFAQREPFIPFVSFFRTYNEGIAFSLLSFIDNQVLSILIVMVIIFVLWMWYQMKADRLFSQLGYVFILAGAIGNLIDRIALGHVIDFIQFHTDNWSFAIFNLADSFVTIGAAFIILDEIIQMRKSNKRSINE